MGAQKTTLLGLAIYGLGFSGVHWTPSKNLTHLLLSFAGLGMTLISGAIFAWFVDVNAFVSISKNRVADNRRMFLNLDLIRRINLGLGSLIGAWLVDNSPNSVWGVLGLLALMSIFVGSFIISDKPGSSTHTDQPRRALEAIKRLSNPLLLAIIVLGIFYGIETGTRDSIMQPYVVGYLSKGNAFGMVVVQCIVAGAGILGNRLVARWRKKHSSSIGISDVRMLIVPLVTMALVQFLASRVESLTEFGVLYFIGMIGIGWFYPLQSFVLNELIESRHRALILSAVNMMGCLMQAGTCIMIAGRLENALIRQFWLIGSMSLAIGAVIVTLGAMAHFSRQK